MASLSMKAFDTGNFISIIACVLTMITLLYTLYFWLFDHLRDDESKFIRKKHETLKIINDIHGRLSENATDAKGLLEAVEGIQEQLETILSYRFWGTSRQRKEYDLINDFFHDSRCLVSMLRRYNEYRDNKVLEYSLIAIYQLDDKQLNSIQKDYLIGLECVVEFIESWR